jgi:outer membrane protein assembly factor BamB
MRARDQEPAGRDVPATPCYGRLVGNRLWPALAVLLIAACGTASPAPRTPPGWTMYRGDLARDGHPPGATLDPAEAKRLASAWVARLGSSIDGSPAVAGGLVIVGTESGTLAAVREARGDQAWRVDGLGPITDSPTVAEGRVVAATLSGTVDAFDERSGRRLWTWRSPGDRPAIWSSPAVNGGRVMVGIASQFGDTPLEAGRLVALSLSDGRPLWDDCLRSGCQPGDGVWSSLAVDGAGRGYVGVGNPDDAVLAVDVASGRRLWETSLHPDQGRDLDVGATPVLVGRGSGERVAVGSNAGDLTLLNAASGRPVWSRTVVSGSAVHGLLGSPAYDGRRLYVPSASPPTGVFAISAEAGETVWQRSSPEPVYTSPALGDGTLAVGTGAVFGSTAVGRVLVLATDTGAVAWSRDLGSAVWSSPAIVGSTVYVGDHAGSLHCFRAG